jgi:signal transduction histidine kinase
VRIINEEREVVASIAQELRQPMASLTGYTELLLAESAGILGALQRKFLERIKASTERMRTILDELVQMTTTRQTSKLELVSHSINAGTAIDKAISETRAQIQEKNITLQIDLPEELPNLAADRDAIQQILVHLLQNASSATPQDGTITLRARMDDTSTPEPYLLIQVIDTGGGIAPSDLSKVFSRRYRADNPLIQGIGDTGVGLAIAKTLTEAHGGRIWVESEPGKNSTFSLLLPTQHRSKPAENRPV